MESPYREGNDSLDRAMKALNFSFVVLLFAAAILFINIALATLLHYGYLTIFEDGSYWLFNWSGCLPFSLCN